MSGKGPIILVVDDEADLLELLSYHLEKEGYEVKTATSGEAAIVVAKKSKPALILLDIMLPGIDGLEVCRSLKKNISTNHIPIAMLTAKGEDAHIIEGLEMGADDYIIKPFKIDILLARVRALLRRGDPSPNHAKKVHNIKFDRQKHTVSVSGDVVDLTHSEFSILSILFGKPGWVFTRGQIIDAMRGEGYAVTDRVIDVHVASLRKKLGNSGKYVETVRGIGYRMKETNV